MTTNSTPEAGTSPPASEDLSRLHSAATIDYRHEVVRKGIHLVSLSIPIIYSFIDKTLALQILIPIMAGFLIVDLGRHASPSLAQWFYRWFGWLLRRHEQITGRWRLNGASNVMIAATLSILIFPKIIAINAFAILIISDTTSALIGRRFGRRRFLSKSLEGSASFLISAILVVLVAPKVQYAVGEYLVGFVAAAVGAVVEASSIRIDDNLSIPISVGITLWILYSFLLPSIPLIS